MKVETSVALHNRFEATLVDKEGKVKQRATAENVVLNRWYESMNTANKNLQITGIIIGTGTGTPAITDTDLFKKLGGKPGTIGNVKILGDNQYSMTVTVTFTENEGNGLLTEVGVGTTSTAYDKSGTPYTHAMFTDAEGSTIAIEKTDTDRLTIVATLYLSITYPSSIIPWPVGYNRQLIAIPAGKSIEPKEMILSDLPALIQRCFGRSTAYHYMSLVLADKAGYSSAPIKLTVSATSTQSGIRVTANRVLSGEQNLQYTYQIKGLSCELGLFYLPNHDVFPPLSVNLEAVGDGEKTGFNFGIAELMPEVEVYVDDVLQPTSAYTWNGKDFSIRQAWASQNGTYLISQPRVEKRQWSGWLNPVAFCVYDYEWYWSSTPIFIYDFGTDKSVNELRCSSFGGIPGTCILYKSDDKETWTEVSRITDMTNDNDYQREFTAVTARYYKLEFDSLQSYSKQQGDAGKTLGAFDFVTNQLEFVTPPTAGSVIKVKAKTEYPIKNSNWLIDQMVLDYSITRGGT